MGGVHARRLASKQKKQGYGSIASAQRAVAADVALIRKGSWVRRRRNGTSPQFGSAKQKAAARSLRSAYRYWLYTPLLSSDIILIFSSFAPAWLSF